LAKTEIKTESIITEFTLVKNVQIVLVLPPDIIVKQILDIYTLTLTV